MTRDELLQAIQDAKVAWEAVTILVSPEEQEAPLLDGWSVIALAGLGCGFATGETGQSGFSNRH